MRELRHDFQDPKVMSYKQHCDVYYNVKHIVCKPWVNNYDNLNAPC